MSTARCTLNIISYVVMSSTSVHLTSLRLLKVTSKRKFQISTQRYSEPGADQRFHVKHLRSE